jgi:hypothetical protein
MEHTPGLETSPPGSDTLEVAGGRIAPRQRFKRPVQKPLIILSIAHHAVI